MRLHRPPAWRIAVLLVVLAAVVAYALVRLPRQPDRSTLALRGHTARIAVAGPAWPEAMHDAAHTGTSGSTGPQTGRVRWARQLLGNATPGPVVGQGGEILAATDKGVLHALDPLTGKDLWTYDSGFTDGSDLSTSPAVLPSGVIVWATPGRQLAGLDPSGQLVWQLTLSAPGTSPALLPDGTGVVLGDAGGTVSAIAIPADGPATVRWSLQVGQASYGSVALSADGATIYQTVTDAVVSIHDDGHRAHIAWRHGLPAPVEVSPAVTPDGGVVTGAGGDKEYGLDRDGRLRWTHDRRSQTYSSPVVSPDGLAAFGDHAGIVTVVDATTGRLAARDAALGHREYPRTIGIWSSPVFDRDHDVYVATFQGHVEGFAPDGRTLFDLDDGVAVDSYPALTRDGGLVVADTGGTIRLIADH